MSAIDINDSDLVGSIEARKSGDTFHTDGWAFVFDDSESSSFFNESMGFASIINFSMPELRSMREEALDNPKVLERRDKRIEKGVRGDLVFNEGVRYGAQYGYTYTLKKFKGFLEQADSELRNIYNFSSLMLSGGKVVPPVISMTKDFVSVSDDTYEHIDERYKTLREARFSRKAPIYHDYLNIPETKVESPNIYMIPLTDNELTYWANGVYQGWVRGRKMAETELTSKINHLHRDFFGMVRFHVMLSYGAVNSPVTTVVNDGVESDKSGMDVGVTRIHINRLSTFNSQSKLWRALPKIDKLEHKHILND